MLDRFKSTSVTRGQLPHIEMKNDLKVASLGGIGGQAPEGKTRFSSRVRYFLGRLRYLSPFSSKRATGKLLRLPFKLIPPKAVLPILGGRLKGKKWIAGSSWPSFWLGIFEYDKQNIFAERILPGKVIYDIGAHVGFYTLLSAELTGPRGRVFAFEPVPGNLYFLKRHILLNKLVNVEVIEAAAADFTGTTFFSESSSGLEGSLSANGDLEVNTVRIDDLVDQGKILPPDYVKIDVEGAELKVLNGASKTLTNYKPVIFLSTHGPDLHRQCLDFLSRRGYRIRPLGNAAIEEADELMAWAQEQA